MKKKLHLKGWTKEEIRHAESIFKKAEKKKHPHIKKVEDSLYWFTLIIGILGTILLSLVLIPILLVSNNAWSYMLTGLFGFLLGALIVIIIKDLHWLEGHHHLLLGVLVPIVAILNFFIVVSRVNTVNYALGLGNYHNPIVIGLIYLVCFVIPYAVFLFFMRK